MLHLPLKQNGNEGGLRGGYLDHDLACVLARAIWEFELGLHALIEVHNDPIS